MKASKSSGTFLTAGEGTEGADDVAVGIWDKIVKSEVGGAVGQWHGVVCDCLSVGFGNASEGELSGIVATPTSVAGVEDEVDRLAQRKATDGDGWTRSVEGGSRHIACPDPITGCLVGVSISIHETDGYPER